MCKIDYQWRQATRGDIGSVARFSDDGTRWLYGILIDIKNPETNTFMFVCESFVHSDHKTIEQYSYCDIQYDANSEP
jgi:hypothetical protein